MTQKIAFYSNILLVLTSIHHAYGAYIYDTPWRFNILYFSIPIIILNIIVQQQISTKKISKYLFWISNLLFTVCQIGLFEGIYSHLLKNLLFFAGTHQALLNQLFPPDTYFMPNNLFFEITGILQAFIAIPLIYYCIISLKRNS